MRDTSTFTRSPSTEPPNLLARQTKFLLSGLKRLGYSSYAEYLGSPHWQAVRNQYRASKLPQTCVVCHDQNVDLHHRTYKRLGRERLTDLVTLCRSHHEAIHDRGLDLWRGAKLLLQERREKDTQRATLKRSHSPSIVGQRIRPQCLCRPPVLSRPDWTFPDT